VTLYANISQILGVSVKDIGNYWCTLYLADDLSCQGPTSMKITDTWRMPDKDPNKPIYQSYKREKK